MKKLIKIIAFIVLGLSLAYSVFSLYMFYVFTPDVICKERNILTSKPVVGEWMLLQYETSCDDARPIVTDIYVKKITESEKHQIFRTESKKSVRILVWWKKDGTLVITLPKQITLYNTMDYLSPIEVRYEYDDTDPAYEQIKPLDSSEAPSE